MILLDGRPLLNMWDADDFRMNIFALSHWSLTQIEPTAIPDIESIESVWMCNLLNETEVAGTA